MKTDVWALYDELIEGIPLTALVDDMACGSSHIYVRSGGGTGICGVLDETWRAPLLSRKSVGMPLRELAECVKSWDFIEAGVGAAAINAWYNDVDRLRGLGLNISASAKTEDRSSDPFITLQREVRGKNVTVIGHFPYIDQLLAPVCNLSVIEKFNPKDGDYPEQAADYLIPESEYVFISSYTFAEKSLPRFLRAAENAYVTIVGPAIPMTPVLFKYGVNDAAGFVVKDYELTRSICLGFGGNIHSVGQKVNLRSADVKAGER